MTDGSDQQPRTPVRGCLASTARRWRSLPRYCPGVAPGSEDQLQASGLQCPGVPRYAPGFQRFISHARARAHTQWPEQAPKTPGHPGADRGTAGHSVAVPLRFLGHPGAPTGARLPECLDCHQPSLHYSDCMRYSEDMATTRQTSVSMPTETRDLVQRAAIEMAVKTGRRESLSAVIRAAVTLAMRTPDALAAELTKESAR